MKILKQILRSNNLHKRKIKLPFMGKYLDNPGTIKYLPAFSKEWKNIIYSYNKNVMRNIPINYFAINKLIKTYFNLYFKSTQFIKSKLQLFLWRRRRLLNKIYVSDADIKYTNNKAIITLFTVNTKSWKIIRKYLKFNKKIRKNFVRHFIKIYKELPWQLNYLLSKKRNLSLVHNKYLFIKEIFRKEAYINYRLQYLKTFSRLNYFYIKKIWMAIQKKYLTRRLSKSYWRKKIIYNFDNIINETSVENKYNNIHIINSDLNKPLIRKISTNKKNIKDTRRFLLWLRRYQLLHALDEYKFNRSKFLPILSYYLNKIIGKKIEYNIINLKSIMNNPDLFTHYLGLKIKRSKSNIGVPSLSSALQMPFIHKEKNSILGKTPLNSSEKKDSLIQKFKNPNIISNLSILNVTRVIPTTISEKVIPSSIVYSKKNNQETTIRELENNGNNSLDRLLKKAYHSNKTLYSTIYNNIKYKNISGMKLEISGRLTKRYKAERARHFVSFKGGFKNKDSSYRKQSTLLFRGNTNINLSYSLQKSKRRIGSFAIKGWLSGK